jgi:hypothetical protein
MDKEEKVMRKIWWLLLRKHGSGPPPRYQEMVELGSRQYENRAEVDSWVQVEKDGLRC